jgi:nitronate monooxygenase
VLREQLGVLTRGTDAPFCVNLVLAFEQQERLELALAAGAPWASFSWGIRRDLIDRVHAAGARALVQVGSIAQVRAAAEAGADGLIVQGIEAGGHVQGESELLPLLSAARHEVYLPLIAAGGISDPLAAQGALAAGASAVALGTRFVACTESDAHPAYKAALVSAGADETVLTSAFSVGWDAPHRVLRAALEAAERRDSDGPVAHDGETPIPRYAVQMPLAHHEGDIAAMAMYAGTGVATITGEEPAGEIVERFVAATGRWA